jgi:hypothetical protein
MRAFAFQRIPSPFPTNRTPRWRPRSAALRSARSPWRSTPDWASFYLRSDGWAASPVHSSSLPFCVSFNEAVTGQAATLDTGPLARSYPGGSRTHLSMKHFQFAPDPHVRWFGEGGQRWPSLSDSSTFGRGFKRSNAIEYSQWVIPSEFPRGVKGSELTEPNEGRPLVSIVKRRKGYVIFFLRVDEASKIKNEGIVHQSIPHPVG